MTERYQVTFHATDLPNGRYFGTACPYAKVKVRTNDSTGPPAVDLGETEIIMKDLSPTWTKIFFLNFSGATVTNIDVTIYDDRGERKEPKYIGEASFEATSVFQSPGKIQSEQLGRAESSRYVVPELLRLSTSILVFFVVFARGYVSSSYSSWTIMSSSLYVVGFFATLKGAYWDRLGDTLICI